MLLKNEGLNNNYDAISFIKAKIENGVSITLKNRQQDLGEKISFCVNSLLKIQLMNLIIV